MTSNSRPVDPLQVQRSFSLLAFIVNRHLMNHMKRISMEIDMDFEAAYLYGTLAHLNIFHLFSPTTGGRRVLSKNGLVQGTPTPVRLTDVAQVSGLPRETVRRKLEWLKARGKVLRTPEGLWCYDENGVDAEIVGFTLETIDRFLKTADEMRAVINSAPSAPTQP